MCLLDGNYCKSSCYRKSLPGYRTVQTAADTAFKGCNYPESEKKSKLCAIGIIENRKQCCVFELVKLMPRKEEKEKEKSNAEE